MTKHIIFFKLLIYLGLIIIAPIGLLAQEHGTSSNAEMEAHAAGVDHEEKFDPAKVVSDHISDSHQWHLWGDHGHSAHIPLPVILKTDKGIECFMSSNVERAEDVYKGKYYNYKLENEKIEIVDNAGNKLESATASIIDISITKNVAQMFISVIVLLFLFVGIANSYKTTGITTAPTGKQSFFEPVILFIRDDVAKPNLGEHYERFMPYLLTIFFFILINNLFGMIPIGANLSGNIAFTLAMAVITFIVTQVNGTKTYWGHVFTPHVPLWMYPIMLPVEIVGLFTKPFALMIRLFSNITAGHIIIISLVSMIFIFKSLAVSFISVPFALFIDVLELLVAFLQAFIFTMLTALFIGGALEKPHHEEVHAADNH